MKLAVILSSLKQKEDIERINAFYKKLGYLVEYPTEQPANKTFVGIAEDYFYKISQADLVIVIPKSDGTLGHGVSYELAFARFLNKDIRFEQSNNY